MLGFFLAFLITLYGLVTQKSNSNKFSFNNSAFKSRQTLVNRSLPERQFASNDHNVNPNTNNASIVDPNVIEPRRYFEQKFAFHADHPRNFTEAKRLARFIFSDHRKTFYCGCKYDKHNKIDLRSCGYEIQGDKRRATRVEWEHIVPISQLASHLPCWQKRLCCKENGHCYKGRQCCREIDTNFAKMEADLHNLVPEIGELNGLRSNYRFGMLPFVKPGQFGACEFKVDSSTRRVEPRPLTRGTIARTYLYMSNNYGMRLSDSQRQLFEAWNKEHPPEAWELEWDRRVERAQGNSNPFISKAVRKL